MSAPLPLVSIGPSPARGWVPTRRVRLFVAVTLTSDVFETAVALAPRSHSPRRARDRRALRRRLRRRRRVMTAENTTRAVT